MFQTRFFISNWANKTEPDRLSPLSGSWESCLGFAMLANSMGTYTQKEPRSHIPILFCCHLKRKWLLTSFLFLKKYFYLFIWLHWVFTEAPRSLLWHTGSFSCGMRDLDLWPRTEPWPPALGAQSLSHWTTREAQDLSLLEHIKSQVILLSLAESLWPPLEGHHYVYFYIKADLSPEWLWGSSLGPISSQL